MKLLNVGELKPYPKMKNSYVEWLGEVPRHWAELPLKRISRIDNSGHYGEEPENGECVLPVATTAQINKDGQFAVNDMPKRGFSHKDADRYRCHPGDILVVKSSGSIFNVISGKAGIVESTSPEFVFSNFLLRVVAYRGVVNPPFLFLLLSGHLTGERVKRMVSGSTYPNLRVGEYISALFPIPPIEEQTAIVRFLDHADRRIRRYIRAKQKLIALLEEQKQAIIHQAVTGQIDVRTGQPYPAYKDSGVEWLGDVPEHWGKTRLKVVLSHPTQNGLFKKKDQFGAGAPLINVADVYEERFHVEPSTLDRVQATPEEIRRFQVQDGDIFFVRSSLKLEGTGRSAIATNCSPDTVFECHLVQARPDDCQVNPRYLVVQLNSYAFRHLLISRANMVTMATIAQDTISSCPVVMPPHSEQDRIVRWIDTQWDRITNAIESGNREIDFIHEYRTRLISDVVTGKLDVREAAAELPEVDPLAEDDLDGTIHDKENSNLGELDAGKSAAEYTIAKGVTV